MLNMRATNGELWTAAILARVIRCGPALRMIIAMSSADGPNTLDWIPLGEHACGLVFGGRIVALVYWQGAPPGGDHGSGEAGFWWVPAELPVDHFSLFAASYPDAADWARARE